MRNRPAIDRLPVRQREQHPIRTGEHVVSSFPRPGSDDGAVGKEREFLNIPAGAGGEGVHASGVKVVVGVRVFVGALRRGGAGLVVVLIEVAFGERGGGSLVGVWWKMSIIVFGDYRGRREGESVPATCFPKR